MPFGEERSLDERRVGRVGGWLSLTGRQPEPVDRPGPAETASEALEGQSEELDPFPRRAP